MIMIGKACSVNTPTDTEFLMTDRQEKIELINNTVVQDFGYIDKDDVISFTAIFDAKNAALIKSYWINRTLVTYIDESGNARNNQRVIVKSYSYVAKFNSYYSIKIELWNC